MVIMRERRRFTVEEYHQMGTAGILAPDERVELLDGQIVRMSPIGDHHALCVGMLNELFIRRLGDRVFLWPQNPLRLGRHTELQPDIALLVPPASRYRGRSVGPGDVLLLVEVADTSLRYDRLKSRRYAATGIRETWLVDLAGEAVEVLREPGPGSYGHPRRAARGESLAPVAFPDLQVAVDAIL